MLATWNCTFFTLLDILQLAWGPLYEHSFVGYSIALYTVLWASMKITAFRPLVWKLVQAVLLFEDKGLYRNLKFPVTHRVYNNANSGNLNFLPTAFHKFQYNEKTSCAQRWWKSVDKVSQLQLWVLINHYIYLQ